MSQHLWTGPLTPQQPHSVSVQSKKLRPRENSTWSEPRAWQCRSLPDWDFYLLRFLRHLAQAGCIASWRVWLPSLIHPWRDSKGPLNHRKSRVSSSPRKSALWLGAAVI